MRIKIILFEPFLGITNGWATRYIGMMTSLSKYHDLHIFAPGDTSMLSALFPNANVCESTSEESDTEPFSLGSYFHSILFPAKNPVFFQEYRFYSDFSRLLIDTPSECECIFYFGLYTYIRYHDTSTNIPVICDFCDSRLRHLLSQKKDKFDLISSFVKFLDILYVKRLKRAFIPSNLTLIAITKVDSYHIQRCLKKNNIVTIPNGVDFPVINDLEKYIETKWHENRILFFGSLDYQPNLNSIYYIIHKIWPEVQQRCPEAILCIAGRNPSADLKETFKNIKNVELYSNVQDKFEIYKKAKVLLCPIFSGGGLKNKILEALAVGTPIITTNEGATGIGLLTGIHGIVSSKREELLNGIEKIFTCEKEIYRTFVLSCRSLGKSYSWESVTVTLNSLVEDKVQPFSAISV